jgi:hypothetical protein
MKQSVLTEEEMRLLERHRAYAATEEGALCLWMYRPGEVSEAQDCIADKVMWREFSPKQFSAEGAD